MAARITSYNRYEARTYVLKREFNARQEELDAALARLQARCGHPSMRRNEGMDTWYECTRCGKPNPHLIRTSKGISTRHVPEV